MLQALESFCWLLPPSRFKNVILRGFGHQVSLSAKIFPNIVLGVRRFEIGENVRVGPFSVFRGLSLVKLADHVIINSWNWISAAPEFQRTDPQAGTLDMHYGAGITSRQYLDVSGTIILERHARIGGGRAFLQTHDVELERGRQMAGRIVIGHHANVATRAVILMGGHLPAQSLLGCNSVLKATEDTDPRQGLYAGAPAHWRRETQGQYFVSKNHVMTEFVIEGQMGPSVSGALSSADHPVRAGNSQSS